MADIDEILISEMPADLSDIWQRIVRGADWETSLTMLDENDVAEDTTGWACEVKIKKPDDTLIKTLSVGAGVTNTAAQGRFDILYAAADTALLTVQKVKITVKVTDAGGGVDYLIEAVKGVYYI